MPVRTLAVEVLEGPQAGMRAEADTEVLTVGTAEGNVVKLEDPTVSRFHLELVRDDEGVRLRAALARIRVPPGDLAIAR